MNPEVERFLVESTAGLCGDRELQLDVQAELQSHIAERVDELLEAGRSPEKASEEALRAMGELTELAPALLDGNARRLSVRARIRQVVRFGLPVLALLVLALCLELNPTSALKSLQVISGDTYEFEIPRDDDRFSEQERLILYGDLERSNGEQQRAIWETEPDNPVYYGNYMSTLSYERVGFAAFEKELTAAETVDPENALYPLMRAAKLLDLAVDTDEEGTAMTVKDETQLAAGLAELDRALALPLFKRRQFDMLKERLAILGAPSRMGEHIERIALSAGVLLPELRDLRQAARVAGLEGERVAERDGLEAAAPLLRIGERLAQRLNDDASTLIDVLVVAAILEESGERNARVHEAAGDSDAAAAIRERTTRLVAPKTAWRAGKYMKTPSDEGDLHFAGGSLMKLFTPAVRNFPEKEAYRESRMLDYTVAEQAGVCLLLLAAFLIAIGCALVALRRRLGARGDAIPVLMLPSAHFSLKVLGIALLLPLLVRGLYLHLPLVGARSYSAFLVPQWLVLEFVLIGGAMLVLITLLIRDFVRRRCCELRIDAPEAPPAWQRKTLIGVAVVGVALLMSPAPFLKDPDVVMTSMNVYLGLLGLGVFLAVGVALWRGLFGRAKMSLYYGSFARSALPFFCAAIIIIGGLARPLLLQREARLLAQDPLMPRADGAPAVSLQEQELTERLRRELAAAMAAEQTNQ